MKILGIETSCDETAAAVVEMHRVAPGAVNSVELLSNVVASSMDLQVKYGGVVPEVAARAQIESIIPVINEALTSAFQGVPLEKAWEQIGGIAVTYGAGLGGSLLVGVLTASTLAVIKNKPLYAINHVEGHIYANFITEASPYLATNYKLPTTAPAFPMLALIVSGGHTQLVFFKNHFDYTLLGQTQDDAIGEAFDKVAKILGLPYPGGPSIGKAAEHGDPHKYLLPKAHMTGKYDFSFSGLKTAVLRLAQLQGGKSYDFPSFKLSGLLNEVQKADIAASFQHTAIETVTDKTVEAVKEFKPKSVVIGGGVASSPELRRQLAERLPFPAEYTDPKLCTDNGAMIATLGCYKAMYNQPQANPYSLGINPNLSM